MNRKEFVENLKLVLNNNAIENKTKTHQFSEEEMLLMRDAYVKFLKKIESNSEDYPLIRPGEWDTQEGWYIQDNSSVAGHYPSLYYYYWDGYPQLRLHLLNPYDLNPSAPSYDVHYPRRIWVNSYPHGEDDEGVLLRYIGLKLPIPMRTLPYLNWLNENPFEVKE